MIYSAITVQVNYEKKIINALTIFVLNLKATIKDYVIKIRIPFFFLFELNNLYKLCIISLSVNRLRLQPENMKEKPPTGDTPGEYLFKIKKGPTFLKSDTSKNIFINEYVTIKNY